MTLKSSTFRLSLRPYPPANLVPTRPPPLQESSSLFGFLLGGSQVLAAASSTPSSPPLQPWDVLLLQNFLLSSPAFLHAEAFTPFCLPHYNPAANLHAYVHYLHAPSRTAVVLLCGSPPDFHGLSAARRHMQRDLQSAGTLQVGGD